MKTLTKKEFEPKNEEATISYASGWMLRIKKTGYSPGLFMEYLAQNPKIKLEMIHEQIEGYFSIRISGGHERYIECQEYINNNL